MWIGTMDRRTVIEGAMAGVAVALVNPVLASSTSGLSVRHYGLPIYYTDVTVHEKMLSQRYDYKKEKSIITYCYYADIDIFSPDIPLAEENSRLWKIRAVYGIQDDIHVIEKLSKTRNHILVGMKAHSFLPLKRRGGYRIKELDLSLFNNFVPSLYLDVV
jgi:hypothetical protein